MFVASPVVRQLADALRPALSLDGGTGIGTDLLVAAIERHRVGALLHRAAVLDPGLFSDEVRQALSSELDRSTLRVLRQKAAMRQLANLLEGESIGFAEIKGWRLGELLYGGEALRHSKDVDLLVESARLPAAIGLVAKHGYQAAPGVPLDTRRARMILRYHREVPIRDPRTGVQIELHSRTLSSPPPGWNDGALLREPLDLGSAEYVLYLILHGAGSRWNRLKWLCDLLRIAQLAPPQVRDEVVEKAGQFDCSAALAASFHAAGTLWDDPTLTAWRDAFGLTRNDPAVSCHLAAFATALNREGNIAGAELLARRLELVRDPPLFGDRYPARLPAMWSRASLWFLRKVR